MKMMNPKTKKKMTKDEYHSNINQRNASIMIGALLQDAAASADALITEPTFDKALLPLIMELSCVLYDVAELISSKVGETDAIDTAMDDLDMVTTKVLKYREDLTK